MSPANCVVWGLACPCVMCGPKPRLVSKAVWVGIFCPSISLSRCVIKIVGACVTDRGSVAKTFLSHFSVVIFQCFWSEKILKAVFHRQVHVFFDLKGDVLHGV